MLFNSWQFGIFLPIVFGLYWLLPHKYRWTLLFIASYYFYMSWNVKYVVLILFTTVVSYLAAILLELFHGRERVKKLFLWLTLVACLGVLFVFKYFNFFMESFSFMAGKVGIQLHPITLRLLLPVGISFYTFQTLAYVIDVYRGSVKPERHFGIYATFISFFPQLVAGPIERTRNLLPQIKDEHIFNYDQATYGLKLMAWGFFKKLCIADNFAVYVDKVFNDIYSFHGFSLILATFLFTIQIYCDFSGYSDIARGTAKLFGIELMENFKSPYFSSSIHEFWSRWHISLSTWFRDYVYIPLGGNRVSAFRHKLNLLLTFIISGLWHGANWTFIIWGSVHEFAQVIEKSIFTQQRETQDETHGFTRVLKILLVFLFCMFAWIFFRARNLNEAFYVFEGMLNGVLSPLNYLKSGFRAIGINKLELCKIFLCLAILSLHDFLSLKRDLFAWLGEHSAALRYAYIYATAFLILMLGYVGQSTFVYFQF